jgi:predicted ribosome quality control (RQC) complex YloA/Tae2 family protein
MPIGLDGLGIALLVRELKDLLKGRLIQSIRLSEDNVLTIALGEPGPRYLRFLVEPPFPLVALGGDPGIRRQKQGPPAMPRFEDPLTDQPISTVEQIDLDRVIKMTVGDRQDEQFHLYFELIPPHPNLFLTGADGTIKATLFKAGTQTRKRILTRGKQYTPPLPQDKADPFKVGMEDLESLPWREDDEVLSKSFHGIGPFLSKEIVSRAGHSGSLGNAFREVIEAHRKGEIKPAVSTVSPEVTRTPPWIGATWYESCAPWVGKQAPVSSLNEAVSRAINEFTVTSALERGRAVVARSVARDIKKWRKAEKEAEKAETDKETGDRLRKFGEIIVANLKSIKKGLTEVRLPDIFSEEGEDITIPLKPHLSPHANAEAYFKKSRKALRRANLAHGSLTAARTELKRLRALLKELTSEEIAEKRIEEMKKMFASGGPAGKPAGPVDEKAERLGIKPRRYVVTDGWAVLVGRSAKENDILTHRYATPGDLWFHAGQAQGSHVVLKRGRKKTQVSKQAISEAAAIAAHFSKARTSKHVPVSYTEKRYVKKVRKGAPGLCIMLREKVVFVEPALPKR